MAATDPTQRFSSRVGNYVRFRPGYPSPVIDLLRKECGLTSSTVIADVASGTGIFTRMLLEKGSRVFGVEPNAEMRKAGEEFLVAYPHFTSVEGLRKRQLWRITALNWSPPPRPPIGSIVRRRGVSSCAF